MSRRSSGARGAVDGLVVVLVGIALLLVLSGCAPASLKIGFVGPLSGSSSAIGQGCRDGFLMALGSGPGAAPGKLPALDFLIKDDLSDPDRGVAAVQELYAAGCRVLVLGTPSQAATKDVPWAVEHGMLVISPTVSSLVKGSDSPLFVRVNTSSENYGKALARIAVQRFKAMHAGVIGDSHNANYVNAVNESFALEYGRLGGTPAFVRSFDSSKEGPQSGLVDAIISTKADALLVITASTEAVLVAKELERADLHTQLLLPPWPLTLDLLRNGGRAVEGAVAVSIADFEFRTPAGKEFEGAFKARYGEEPSFTAMFGWEAAAILRAAIAAEGSRDASVLRDRIMTIGRFEGLQGPIEFSPAGIATRTMFTFRIEDGAFKRID